MKKQTLPDTAAYNTNVRQAYFIILKKTMQLLSRIEKEELRFYLERWDNEIIAGTIVHEIINPIIYLRLECHSDNLLAIHFGIEQVNELGHLSYVTTTFLRFLYKLSSIEVTSLNIEDSIRTDGFINSCSTMFEYILERNKYHELKQIKYTGRIKTPTCSLSVA